MRSLTFISVVLCSAISLFISVAIAKADNSNFANANSDNPSESGKPNDKNHDKNRGHRHNRGQAFEPFHSNYVVLSGDTFYVNSLKEYATSANAKFIARFNHLAESQALVPGQTINLPSISPAGVLAPSHAPVADSLQALAKPVAPTNFNPPATFNSTAKSSKPAKVIPITLPKPVVGTTAQASSSTSLSEAHCLSTA